MQGLFLAAQVLLALSVDGPGPVRFGYALEARHLERGLRLEGPTGARLQWRPLQARPDPATGRQWVELALCGVQGRVRLRAGGSGPSPREQGPAYRYRVREDRSEDGALVREEEWLWADGHRDWRRRTTFLQPGERGGEDFASGEALTETSDEWQQRWLRVSLRRRDWERAGILPRDRGLGREVRVRLRLAREAMVELPGLRGAGDYARSGGVVTNLEYDTALGLLRLGLAAGDRASLAAAWRAARQTADRDRDPSSGLPFPHGQGHRTGVPEPGHTWLQGVLQVGLVSADDDLLFTARSLAGALARHPPRGEGPNERARDYGWPLLEMEAWLRFADDPAIEKAADDLASAIAARFDPQHAVFRFGEGGGTAPLYRERAWLTGGVVLPALRSHLRRRPDRGLQQQVDAAARVLEELVAQGRRGLPLRYLVRDGARFSVLRRSETPEVYLLLEGLEPEDRLRLLRRQTVRRALGEVPVVEHPDLATHFSMVARCTWVWE